VRERPSRKEARIQGRALGNMEGGMSASSVADGFLAKQPEAISGGLLEWLARGGVRARRWVRSQF